MTTNGQILDTANVYNVENNETTGLDENVIGRFDLDIDHTRKMIKNIKKDIELKKAYDELKNDKNFQTVVVEEFKRRIDEALKNYNNSLQANLGSESDYTKSQMDKVKSLSYALYCLDLFDTGLYYNRLEENLKAQEEQLKEYETNYADYIAKGK